MYELLVLPLVGALIGWFTNYLAIKLLFRPYHPWRIPVLGSRVQGLIPRRKRELAASVGKVIEEALLSAQDIVDEMLTPQAREEVASAVTSAVEGRIRAKVAPFLPAGLAGVVTSYISKLVRRETARFLDQDMDELVARFGGRIRLGKRVEKRLKALDLAEIEGLVRVLAARELRAIEYLGGVLGFIIGLLQAGVIIYLRQGLS